jgi:HSP20 family protein
MVNMIRRRDQVDPAASMFPAMNRLMGQFLGDPLLGEMPLATFEEGMLPLDISENENTIMVRASLPGFNPDDIDVQVENGILTIRAEHDEEEEESGERFYRRERTWGSVSRRVVLPRDVRGDAVEADLENGVLTLRIPKSEEAKPKRIQIKGAHGRKQVGAGGQSPQAMQGGTETAQRTHGQPGQPGQSTQGQAGRQGQPRR